MSHTIFLIIALVTTGIFLIQFVLSIFFGDIEMCIRDRVEVDVNPILEYEVKIWEEKTVNIPSFN